MPVCVQYACCCITNTEDFYSGMLGRSLRKRIVTAVMQLRLRRGMADKTKFKFCFSDYLVVQGVLLANPGQGLLF